MYRPHFAYPTPPGCEDQPFEYDFDPSNIAEQAIGSNGSIFGMLFGPLDKDAPFHWRSTRIYYNGADPALGILFKDADGQAMSDAPINLLLYAIGAGFTRRFAGGVSVPLDEEVVCPAGSVIEVNWSREINTASTVPPYPGVTLIGVKRYSGARL